jgi:hypothetical protein
MRTSNVYPALARLETATCIKESSKVPSPASFVRMMYCPQPWFRYVSQRRSLQRGFPCAYVVARATTCPIFQCLVCLCEITLPNYKPIMHFKHSYMHNHAFYVLIHLMILLYHTYMLHFQSQFQFNSISISIQLNLNSQFNSISTLNSVSTLRTMHMPISIFLLKSHLNSMSMSMPMSIFLFSSQFNVYVYAYVYISVKLSIQFYVYVYICVSVKLCLCLYLCLC